MKVKIDSSWAEVLSEEFEKPYFKKLTDFVRDEYQTQTVYPAGSNIFRAFDKCPFDKVKVVIVGQDPYHGEGQANGLCFSVGDGVRLPPSLVNIYKELSEDLGVEAPRSGSLDHWAEQGVLLINSVLTVRANQAASHSNRGWERFTDAVIERINSKKNNVVYILWGSYAQKKCKVVDAKNNRIIQSVHPSPLSSYRGFFGSRPFSRANDYLRATGQQIIEW